MGELRIHRRKRREIVTESMEEIGKAIKVAGEAGNYKEVRDLAEKLTTLMIESERAYGK